MERSDRPDAAAPDAALPKTEPPKKADGGAEAPAEERPSEEKPGQAEEGAELPVVYRWPYDYSVPGAPEDFLPQNRPDPVSAGAEP